MLPSSESKIKETLFIDQSAFSTFALYVITIETEVLLERKTYLVKDLSEPKASISILNSCWVAGKGGNLQIGIFQTDDVLIV